jgi:hypothetical protein
VDLTADDLSSGPRPGYTVRLVRRYQRGNPIQGHHIFGGIPEREAFFSDRATRKHKLGETSAPGARFILVRQLAYQNAKRVKPYAIACEADAFRVHFGAHLIASVSLVYSRFS